MGPVVAGVAEAAYGINQSELKEGHRVLKEGDRAPDFTTVDHTGKETRLADLRGKKVWLWFFSSPGGGN